MSAPKRRLGRGLDALLGSPAPPATPPAETTPTSGSESGLVEIRIDAIRPNPQQPRKTFDAEALGELERSIRELGVLVPIIVRPAPAVGGEARFELIAGERRWRAAAAARLATIPALVREADDRTSMEVAVVENLQRRDLDPLEEAMGFQHLVDEYRFTQDAVADRIGKSRSAVANALRLLALSDRIKALLRAGELSVGHARALLAVDAAERDALADRIVRDGLTVRDVERRGTRHRERATEGSRTGPLPKHPDLEAVEARLRYALGTSVALLPAAKGGKLEIRYADDDELARIVGALVGDER